MFKINSSDQEEIEKKKDYPDKPRNIEYAKILSQNTPFNMRIHEQHMTISLQSDPGLPKGNYAYPVNFNQIHDKFVKECADIRAQYWTMYYRNPEFYQNTRFNQEKK